jgi:hypothetical protein
VSRKCLRYTTSLLAVAAASAVAPACKESLSDSSVVWAKQASPAPRAGLSSFVVGVAQTVETGGVTLLVAAIAWPAPVLHWPVGVAGRGQSAFQAAAAAIWCLWSLRRLWVAVISRHSESAADRPRRWNWLMRRLCLVCANTGSTIAFRRR